MLLPTIPAPMTTHFAVVGRLIRFPFVGVRAVLKFLLG
jgi:hypothetical protein